MKKVLIFFFFVFVGPYLANEFKNDGYEVFGADVQEEPKGFLFNEYFRLNILDESAVYDTIAKTSPTYIINLAAISSVGASWNIPKKTMEINVIGSINIFEAVK